MTLKMTLDDLAIFGGASAFSERLHVGRPNIGNRVRLLERMNDLLDRRWLTNGGPFVKEFEARLSEMVGVKHCIPICNATVALEIAIRALGMSGEVIVPSFTFIATAHALQWQEITPVFCDVDPLTHTIDPRKVEALITPRTTGIIGVHLWGRACDINALSEITKRRNLKLLFDAAHALGCTHEGKMIGSFGDAEVFSFHGTKFINAFEGGAIATNDDELAQKIRLMKNFGFSDYDEVNYIGTNGKMSEASAAMGLTSLESIDEFVQTNLDNYDRYKSGLSGVEGIRLIEYSSREKSNYQYVVLEVDSEIAGISRDSIVEVLKAENILARRYFHPGCHRMEPYQSYFPHAGLLLKNTEKLSTQVMALPTGTAISLEQVSKLCGLIDFIVNNGIGIEEKLNKRKALNRGWNFACEQSGGIAT